MTRYILQRSLLAVMLVLAGTHTDWFGGGSHAPVFAGAASVSSHAEDVGEEGNDIDLLGLNESTAVEEVRRQHSIMEAAAGIMDVSSFRSVHKKRKLFLSDAFDFIGNAASATWNVVSGDWEGASKGFEKIGNNIASQFTLGACTFKGCSSDNMKEYWEDTACDSSVSTIAGAVPGVGPILSVFTNKVQKEACPDEVEEKIKKIFGDSIPKLEKGLGDARKGISRNGKEIKKLRPQIQRNRRDIINLQSDVSENRRNINILQGGVSRNTHDILRLQGAVNANAQDIVSLRGDIARHDRDIHQIRGDIRDLQAEDARIRSDIRNIRGDINVINARVAGLRRDVDTLAENDRLLRLEQIRQQQKLKLVQEELLRQRQADEVMLEEIRRLKQADLQLLENDRRLMEEIKENKQMFIRGLQAMESRLEQTKLELLSYTDERFVQTVRTHLVSLRALISKFTLPKVHSYEDFFVEASTGEAKAAKLGIAGLALTLEYAKIKILARVNILSVSLVQGSDSTTMDEYFSQYALLLTVIEESEYNLDSVAEFLSLSDDPVSELGDKLSFSLTYKEYYDFRRDLQQLKESLVESTDQKSLAYLRDVSSSSSWQRPQSVVSGSFEGMTFPAITTSSNYAGDTENHVVLYPSGDTFYHLGHKSNTNNGSGTVISIGTASNSIGMIKFNPGIFNINDRQTYLRLHIVDLSASATVIVKKLASTNVWRESTTEWDSVDSDDFIVKTDFVVTNKNSWADIDVTDLVAFEEFEFTLAIEVLGGDKWVNFTSSEVQGLSPQLLVLKKGGDTNIVTDSNLFCDEVASENKTLYPDADTYVRGGEFEHDNYGFEKSLVVKNNHDDEYKHRAVMRFDLKDVKIQGARVLLRLFVEDVNSSISSIIQVNSLVDGGEWKENDLTFSTMPDIKDSGPSVVVSSNDEGQWVHIDITPLLEYSSTSLVLALDVIEKDPTSGVSLATRESPSSPELLFHYCQSNLEIDLGQEEAVEMVILDGIVDLNIPGNEVTVELRDSERNLISERKVEKNTGEVSYLYFRPGASEYIKSKAPASIARFVTVKASGTIILNQIFVFGADRAVFKSTRQSSTEFSFESSNAVDNGSLSLSRTKVQSNPWWEIDLEYLQEIGAVYFQTFGCSSLYPCNLEITFADFSGNIAATESIVSDGTKPGYVSFQNGIPARIIRITLRSDEERQLSLNQFQVFGPLDSDAVRNKQPSDWFNAGDRVDSSMEFKLVGYKYSCLTASGGQAKLKDCRGMRSQQWQFYSNTMQSLSPVLSSESSASSSKELLLKGVLKSLAGECLSKVAPDDYSLSMRPCKEDDLLQNFEYSPQSGLLYHLVEQSETSIMACLGVEQFLTGRLVLLPCDNRVTRSLWDYAGKFEEILNVLSPQKALVPGQFISSPPLANAPRTSTKTEPVFHDHPPTSITSFDNGDGMDTNRLIKTIHIFHGLWIDGLGSEWTDGTQDFPQAIGGDLEKIELASNEFITKIRTSLSQYNNQYIGSLTFYTSTGNQYGPFGDFDSARSTIFEAPANHMLGGLHGSYHDDSGTQNYLVSIGFYWVPITRHYFGLDFSGDLSMWRETFQGDIMYKIWSGRIDGFNGNQKLPVGLSNSVETVGGSLNFLMNGEVTLSWSKSGSTSSETSCYSVHFTTSTDVWWASSTSPFEIVGYGEIPSSCLSSLGAECDLSICGMDTLEILAKGSDAWVFTVSGDVGLLLGYTTVLGGRHHEPHPSVMDTDEYDSKQVFELRKDCFSLNFKTSDESYAESGGPFVITGYGEVPSSCHSERGAECDITVCGQDTLEIHAMGNDAWFFSISGDVGLLLDYTTVSGGQHYDPFPTRLDTDDYDSKQVFELRKDCFSLNFKTSDEFFAESGDSFVITGYGEVPSSCHSERGAECDIIVCGRNILDIHAIGDDSWLFSISGDIGMLVDYTTVQGGRHVSGFPTGMDTDQWDSWQRYTLKRQRKPATINNNRRVLTSSQVPSGVNKSQPNRVQLLETSSASKGVPPMSRLRKTARSKCHSIRFKTSYESWAVSSGPFYIDGYGEVPRHCHSSSYYYSSNGECELEICGTDMLVLRAQTDDGWIFTIEGDIGNLVYYETVPGKSHLTPFPTRLDTNESDILQIYELTNCYSVHFTTNSDWSSGALSSGPFTIDNYGTVPSICHLSLNSDCELEICGTDELTLRAETTDGWAFTIDGDIGDIMSYETIPGGAHYIPFPTFVDTDQFDRVQTYKLQKCYKIHFETNENVGWSTSSGPFSVDGYGTLPSECHSNLSSTCDIEVCGTDKLVIRAGTHDGWGFTASGEVGTLLSYETVSGGEHWDGFPTLMDTDQYDTVQTYQLGKCYKIQFITDSQNIHAASTGPFTVDGYGTLPSSCHSSLSSQCHIEVCGTNTLVMKAGTTDGWKFRIVGDIGPLIYHKTSTGGRHTSGFPTWMDNKDNDWLQMYKLRHGSLLKPFTVAPTANPTKSPTVAPTAYPTKSPSVAPTANPSAQPSVAPTAAPSFSSRPTVSDSPSMFPSSAPSVENAELRITEDGQLELFGNSNFVTLSYARNTVDHSFLELEGSDDLVLGILSPHIGTPVTLQVKDHNNAETQKWKLTSGGYLQNQWNGLVVEIVGSAYTSFLVQMASKNGDSGQKWYMSPEGHLVSRLNEKVLSLSSSGTITLSTKTDAGLQKWFFSVHNCGCAQCSESELSRKVPDAEGLTCASLINDKMSLNGGQKTEEEGCSIIGEQYANLCGLKCDPAKCVRG